MALAMGGGSYDFGSMHVPNKKRLLWDTVGLDSRLDSTIMKILKSGLASEWSRLQSWTYDTWQINLIHQRMVMNVRINHRQ